MTDWITLFASLITLAGLNLGALRWLLDRHEREQRRDLQKIENVACEVADLRATLPIEYVRREDWIRFGATLDAKLDALREELRDELAELKRETYGHRD